MHARETLVQTSESRAFASLRRAESISSCLPRALPCAVRAHPRHQLTVLEEQETLRTATRQILSCRFSLRFRGAASNHLSSKLTDMRLCDAAHDIERPFYPRLQRGREIRPH